MNIYIMSNNTNLLEDCFTRIEEVLTKIKEHIILPLMGDFKLPNVVWLEGLFHFRNDMM